MCSMNANSPSPPGSTVAIDNANVPYQLLVDVVQQCADQIDVPTRRLLAVVELMQRSSWADDAQARRLWSMAERLAEGLRAHLKDAEAWLLAISGNHPIDLARLQDAPSTLRRSVDRASVLLSRSDILLATSGPGVNLRRSGATPLT